MAGIEAVSYVGFSPPARSVRVQRALTCTINIGHHVWLHSMTRRSHSRYIYIYIYREREREREREYITIIF